MVGYSCDATDKVLADTSDRAFHYTVCDLVHEVSRGASHTKFHFDVGKKACAQARTVGSHGHLENREEPKTNTWVRSRSSGSAGIAATLAGSSSTPSTNRRATGADSAGTAECMIRTERGAQYLNDLQTLFLPA